MNLIFDSHAHYDDEAFDEDRKELLASLANKGIGYVVDVSAALEDIPHVLKLADTYDFIYATSGIHPSETGELTEENFSEVVEALKHSKVVAVGEIGLDYHYEDTDKVTQKKWFARQIDLARQENYPIVIHSRDAAKDTLDIVLAEQARDVGGVVHCFSYEKEMARRYLDLGFYIGIGGVLTFKNARKLREIAEYMPVDRILLETDCPYLAPEPYRGKRNDSTLLHFVVDALSEIRRCDQDELIGITSKNAMRMYRITE